MTISRVRPRAVVVLATTVMLALATTGCGEDETVDLPEPAPPQTAPVEPPEPELTADEQQAVDEVQTIFEQFMTAYVEILTAGETPTDAVVAPFLELLTSPLTQQANEVYDNYQNERRADGHLDWEFTEVVDVDLENVDTFPDGDRTVPLVWLRYCVDATDWRTVEKSTGDVAETAERHVVAPGERTQVTVEAAYFDPSPVEPWDDPAWRLGDWEYEEDRPC